MNDKKSILEHIIYFCLRNKLVVFILLAAVLLWGLKTAPFDWNLPIQRDPVPVDAIPDIGENQQIVFTKWMGRSPKDVEDQVTYPLTVSLLGIPGVKTVRSFSMLGFSSIYVIFKEDIEFYWSRSRILEKLNSLPGGTLPENVRPMLGPDATALGQVYWYTLEGRDPQGNPAGGWDLDELRTIQDWYVRYNLLSADGIAEVASVGGFVREYQVDVDPDALAAYGVSIDEVFKAVKMSNQDIGARTIEVNKVEYVIRGLGFIKNIADIENSVIKMRDNVPIYIKNIARVTTGPALRRGALDKEGSEVVGGVVVVRYGDNPMEAIKNLKKKIAEISPGLPQKTLADGTVSKVTVVPFYDRSGLINETLGTLNEALTLEIMLTIIVVILMLMNLRSSLLISGLLPLAVLMSFICMKYFHVDANIVALSGIAIAIGTMVDMGIVMVENIVKHLEQHHREESAESSMTVIFRAASEVGSAVLTAVATTIVSFLPVFTMEAAEGKLFKPLAFTKTFALAASIIVALTIIPPFAHMVLAKKRRLAANHGLIKGAFYAALTGVLLLLAFRVAWWILPATLLVIAALYFFKKKQGDTTVTDFSRYFNYLAVVVVAVILSRHWLPLGPEKGFFLNFLFVSLTIGVLLSLFKLFEHYYGSILRRLLAHKGLFFSAVSVVVLFGFMVWLGFGGLFGWLPESVRKTGPVAKLAHQFPGLGKEFMPPLDEGSFLYMPTTMPHASIGEVLDVLKKQDMAFTAIPEIETAVGKLGRAETPLDPAPVSMIETVINYKSQYILNQEGERARFSFQPGETDFFRAPDGTPLPAGDGESYKVEGKYARDEKGQLIPHKNGYPFRLWRPALDPDLNPGRQEWAGIYSPDDIWQQIVEAAKIPGTTSAPKLQPISTRIVMLQSGMRAPIGIKIKGPDLASIEKVGIQIEKMLKSGAVVSVEPTAVIADRIIGKPYLEIRINREAAARFGLTVGAIQQVISVAVGGKPVTSTVEGRERYTIRIRYMRELRNDPEMLNNIRIPIPSPRDGAPSLRGGAYPSLRGGAYPSLRGGAYPSPRGGAYPSPRGGGGAQIPLSQVADITYVRGPQVIKSEDTFLLGYVMFDKKPGYAEVNVVEEVRDYLQGKIQAGELIIPAGVSYAFAGNYENQVRSEQKLKEVLPVALAIIFLLLYFQFKRVSTTLLVFSGIVVSWSGGFFLIWLYGQSWFLDFSVFGVHMQTLFQVHPINISVAVWVGFLALFGIASDDGVIMGTYLEQVFARKTPATRQEIREAVVEAGKRRIRPALMTIATTILALLPVLTSSGRGADIMVPMAIPTFGGMLVGVLTLFVVPVGYCLLKEMKLDN